jgi:hypothetical protein|tara:strand:- start:413 stop:706 length:294 start_codon:yes stop_codon:yes gene_type:complete
MSTKTLKITQDKDVLEVYVKLEERNDRRGIPKTRFDTHDVVEFLREKKVVHGRCIRKDTPTLKNWHPQLLEGTWVFEKIKQKPRRAKVTTKKKNTGE